MRTVLALDLGTSSIKAVLFDEVGRVRLRVARRSPLRRGPGGVAEIDGDRALAAVASAVRVAAGACGGRPEAVVLSAAMHSIVPIDREGRPLGGVRTWADARGAEVADELRQGRRWQGLHERTGTPVHASSPMCKLAAMGRREKALFARAAAFVSLKELLIRRWFGADVVDASVASASGLYDPGAERYDPEALTVAGVGTERLSRVVSTRYVLTGFLSGVAPALGLDPAVPVVVGGADGALANLGSGADAPRSLAVTLGTSGAARRSVGPESRLRAGSGLFRYVVDENDFVIGGAVDHVGSGLAAMAGLLRPGLPTGTAIARMCKEARRSTPGARGVWFDARLGSERWPGYASHKSGALTGLTTGSSRADVARAVVEGVLRPVADVVAALARRGPVDVLLVGGGVAREPFVLEVLADLTRKRIVAPFSVEASALGAARVASRALGLPDPAPALGAARVVDPA